MTRCLTFLAFLPLLALLAACGGGGGGGGSSDGGTQDPPPVVPPGLQTFSGQADGAGRVQLPAALGGQVVTVLDEQQGKPIGGALVRVVGRDGALLAEAIDPAGLHAPAMASGHVPGASGKPRLGPADLPGIDTVERLLLPLRNRLSGTSGRGLESLNPGLLRDFLSIYYTYRETTRLDDLGPALARAMASFVVGEAAEERFVKLLEAGGLVLPSPVSVLLKVTSALDLVDGTWQTIFGAVYEGLCYPADSSMEIWAANLPTGLTPLIFVLPAGPAPASGPIETTIRIRGTVRDARTAQTLGGVRVYARPGTGSATTDAQGAYDLLYMPRCSDPAQAVLFAQREGYLRGSRSALGLQVGQDAFVDLALNPGTPIALGDHVLLFAGATPTHDAWFQGQGWALTRLNGYPSAAELATARLLYVVAYQAPTQAERDRIRRWVADGGRLVLEAAATLYFAGGSGLLDEVNGGGLYANGSGNITLVELGPVPSALAANTLLGAGGSASAAHDLTGSTATMLARWDATGTAQASYHAYGLGDCLFVHTGPGYAGATFDTFWGDCMRYLLR